MKIFDGNDKVEVGVGSGLGLVIVVRSRKWVRLVDSMVMKRDSWVGCSLLANYKKV